MSTDRGLEHGYTELSGGGGIGYGGPVRGEVSGSNTEGSLFNELQTDPNMCHLSGIVCDNAALLAKLTGRHFTEEECRASRPDYFDGYTVDCGLAARAIEALAQLPSTKEN
jgi:hypothetical protein